jgi:hypothetical protein
VVPTQVAKATPPVPAPAASTVGDNSAGAILPQSAQPSAAQPTASAPPPEQHLAVDAPFIFHGNDPAPDLRQNVVMLKLENTKVVNLEPTVLPPPAKNKKAAPATQSAQNQPPQKTESHGFFSKVGAFFASIFH